MRSVGATGGSLPIAYGATKPERSKYFKQFAVLFKHRSFNPYCKDGDAKTLFGNDGIRDRIMFTKDWLAEFDAIMDQYT